MNDGENQLIQAIRHRPAMYIGSTTVRGFNELVRYLIVFSFVDLGASEFSMEVTGHRTGTVIVSGVGCPVSDSLVINPTPDLSDTRLSPFEFATLNALSQRFEFGFWDDAGTRLKHLAFEKGELKEGTIENQEFSPSKLEMRFDLDDTLLELPQPLNPYFYLEQFKTLAFLNKNKTLGLVYTLDGRRCETLFRFEKGLQSLIDLRRLGSKYGLTLFDTHFEVDFGEFGAEAAFGFWENTVNEPFLVSFVNHERAPENGVHLDSVIEGIDAALKKYAEADNMSGDYPISTKGLKRLLVCAVSVLLERPDFEGSVRNKLLNPEIKASLSSFVEQKLYKQLLADPDSATCLIKRISRESQIEKFRR